MVTSLEAIKYQDDELFKKLTELMTTVREEYADTRIVNPEPIQQYAWDAFKMKVVFSIDKSLTPNAYVLPPMMTTNHALANDNYKRYLSRAAILDAFKSNKPVVGTIDRARHTLGGIFSEMPVIIALTAGIVRNTYYSPEEMAALFLHEAGHAFGWFEMFSATVTTNQAIRGAKELFLKGNDKRIRMNILLGLEKQDGIVIDYKENLAESNQIELVETAIADAYVRKGRSETGSIYYDRRSFEYTADQFVSRLGGGKYLAKAILNLNKDYGHSSTQDPFTNLVRDIYNTTMIVFSSAGLFGLPIIIMIALGDPVIGEDRDSYDRPYERVKRTRNEVMGYLKDRRTPEPLKAKAAEDLVAIDNVLKELKDYESIWSHIYGFFSRKGRSQRTMIERQKILETLLSNELYLQAHKLTQLRK